MMAKAPKPKAGGYDAAKERQERARKVFRISLPDTEFSFTYRPYGIPVRVRGYVRDVTGESIDVLLFGKTGRDVAQYADMWWVSRLCESETGANGKPISRAAVFAEFDEACAGALYDEFAEDDISDEVDDSPEA